MKKLVLIAAGLAAIYSLAQVRAQTPLSAPQVPQTLTTTPELRAAQFDGQVIAQVNSLFYQILTARANGLPARGNMPAVTAAQIEAAFGADNLAKLDAAAAALNPTPTPAPSPSATP